MPANRYATFFGARLQASRRLARIHLQQFGDVCRIVVPPETMRPIPVI